MNKREDRFAQGRRNDAECRMLTGAIKDAIPYFKPLELNEKITLRVEHERVKKFTATKLRRSEHFPGIVPELVSDDGDYMLITWLSYGSLLRLLNIVQ